MFTNWQWIVIFTILMIGYILAPIDNGKTDYHNYNCYDKSVYKCGKCRKKCKWRYIAKEIERIEKNREKEDG